MAKPTPPTPQQQLLAINPATGVTIRGMNAVDLIHRTVTNPNGVEYHVDRLELDAVSGTISIWMTEYDEEGQLDLSNTGEVGIYTLAGWIVS